MSASTHRRAAFAHLAALAVAALTGCANPLRLTASSVRYPVSLTDSVYGPDHRLLRDADLVRVRELSAEADLCAMERANGDGPLDLSPMLNDLIAQSDGEAVVDFHLALQPPAGEVNFHEGDTRCVTVHWTGSVVRRAPGLLALAEVRADCDEHRARACAELARRTLSGEGVAADARAALQLYDGACAGGDAGACAATAAMWREGRHAEADVTQAITYEQRACDLGARDACGRVGITLADERSPLYDPVRARATLAAACEAEDAPSCTALARLLTAGAGGAADVPRALDLYRRACARDATACTRAAAIYAEGRNGRPDLRAALALYGVGCDRGDAAACAAAGEIYAHGPANLASPLLARRSFERACQGGDAAACARVAEGAAR